MIPVIIFLVFVLIAPLLQLALGQRLYDFIRARCPSTSAPLTVERGRDAVVLWIFGLLVHLNAAFWLKSTGLPWVIAALLPLLPTLLRPSRLRATLRSIRIEPNLNFVLWFAVIIGMGLSLFYVDNGVRTPWKNNYGDLTFHLGMITSFVLGDNVPPEYHLFPGERLSYPFLVNFWSALSWWIAPDLRLLAILFAAQWILLWSAVFVLLRGDKYWLLPWALLFAGGSYFHLGENSGSLINQGEPWTVFLTTVWVTQRAAVFGVVTLLAALSLFLEELQAARADGDRALSRDRVVLTGLVLALSLLAHTHLTAAGVLFCGLVLAKRFLAEGRAVDRSNLPDVSIAFAALMVLIGLVVLVLRKMFPGGISTSAALAIAYLLVLGAARVFDIVARRHSSNARSRAVRSEFPAFLIAFVPAFLALPWLVGKAHSTRFIAGWITGEQAQMAPVQQLEASIEMWASNAWPWLCCSMLLYALSRRHLEFAVLAACFLLGNFVQLSFWEWDQLKVFVGLYTIVLAIWATSRCKRVRYAHLSTIVLLLPGVYEAARLFQYGETYTVYDQQKVDAAEALDAILPPDAIVAGSPDHNSLVTLTGRRLYFGYLGTLSSHGIEYQDRRAIQENLARIVNCKRLDVEHELCPDYLLWTADDQRYWRRSRPIDPVEETQVPYLFRIVEQSEGAQHE